MPDAATEAVRERMAALLTRMSQAWREGDFAFLSGLWDGVDDPVYLAEEEPGFARSHAELASYWERTSAGLADVRGDYRLESLTVLIAPLYLATFTNEWAAREKPGEAMVAGTCRAVMIVEAREDRLVPRGYIEAPRAPLIYMRELYKLVATTRGLD
jgi:hypothetical protein